MIVPRFHRPLRLLLGLLILSFVMGSTSAALACVGAPAASVSSSMPAGCPDQPTKMDKHGGAVACVQMCAAIAPAAAPTAAGAPIPSCQIAQVSHSVLSWNAPPEPPPPRAE